jgi:hypothetical protein
MKLEEIFESDTTDFRISSVIYTTLVAWEEKEIGFPEVKLTLDKYEGAGFDVSRYRGYVQIRQLEEQGYFKEVRSDGE